MTPPSTFERGELLRDPGFLIGPTEPKLLLIRRTRLTFFQSDASTLAGGLDFYLQPTSVTLRHSFDTRSYRALVEGRGSPVLSA
jgi:hypothetical protein